MTQQVRLKIAGAPSINKMSENKNILWIDFVKVIATFSVVFLHSAAPLLYRYNNLPLRYWWVGNIYDSMVRMCVPLFFMLSGYLLLGKTESLTTFFSRRVNKVVIPLIVWSIVYVMWRIFYDKDLPLSFRSFYETLLTPTYYHLWFLYAIIGVYLYLPVLRVIVQSTGNEILYYFIALWILAVSIIPLFEKEASIASAFDLAALSGYTGYLIMGYLVGQRKYANKIFLAAIFVALASISITALGTYYFTVRQNKFDGYLYGYLSPNVILLSVSTFILLKYLAENLNALKTKPIRKIIRTLSVSGLGIYLIHPIFLALLGSGDLGYPIGAFSGNPLYYVPITAVLAFTLSFIATTILRQIPIVKRCVP